jgi:methionyl aminopeptidase
VATRKTADEIAVMRQAGRVVAEMHARIREAIRPGVTTADLDRIGRDVLARRHATSNFLDYHGYPAVICASPDDVIVHGIPDDVPLEEGSILSIDCGAIIDGWHGDAAFTAGVGAIDAAAERLIEVAEASLGEGIKQMTPGNRIGDIGAAVQAHAEAHGYSVVREYTGHGIGQAMHESPDVPNHGRPGRGMKLRDGHVLAVEPMLCVGEPATVLGPDGWTVRTADGSLAAHVEHTIAITEQGPEILTLP